MECTSRIELLVPELLDMVVELLHLADTSRLSRCSKRLAARLQHVMFSTQERRTRAMTWACEQGFNTVIPTAISYGAPISTLRPQLHLSDPHYSPYHTSTLGLAAAHQRLDTYKYLIGLGANLDIEYRYHHCAAVGLLLQICKPKLQRAFLEPFLRAGLASQVPDQTSRDSALMAALDPGVVCPEWPTAEVVRMILDWGANPDSGSESSHFTPWNGRCKRFSGWKEPSALSSTVLMRRWDLFDILLERGADIDGLREPRTVGWVRETPRIPLHIPILAAAHAMSAALSDGDGQIDAEPLERCLDAGATIKVSLLSDPKAILGVRDRAHPITPLLVYLDGVETWEPTSDGDDGGNVSSSCAGDRRDVAWGLHYLLDHGASLDGRDPAPTPSGSTAIRTKNDELWEKGRVFTFSPAVQLLLDRWSVRHLLKAPFMKAVKVLIHRGDLKGQEGRVLARYEDDLPDVARGWQDLLTTVLATVAGQEDLNRLLFEYIAAKGEYPHLGALDGVGFPIDELARATVLRLIDAGADINAMVCCQGLKARPQTALFRLCDRYANRESHFFPLNMYRVLPQRAAFLRWLVEVTGADPGIKCAYRTKDGCYALCAPAEVLRAEKCRMNPGEGLLVEELIELFEGRMGTLE